MVRLILTSEDLSHLDTRYKNPSKILDPYGEWVKELETASNILEHYQDLKKKLKDFSIKFHTKESPLEQKLSGKLKKGRLGGIYK